MKNIRNLLLWVLLLTATTGFGQNLDTAIVLKIDLVAAKKSLENLPDHNLPSRAWKNTATGKLHPYFGEAAAELLNRSGEFVNATPEMGEQSLLEATQDSIFVVFGFTSGLYNDGRISYTETSTKVSAYRWFRWDENWMMYIRVGCLNPVLVWEPMPKKKEMDPKGVEECTWELISLYKEKEVEKPCPPPPPPPCDNCCPGDSIFYLFDPFIVLDYERIGGELDKSFGFGLEWLQGRLHRNDKSDIWLEQPTSWYGGLTFYLSEKSVPFRPTCDTCGYWGDIPGGFAFHADAFFGVQHRIFKKKKDTQNQHFGHSGVFGFFEGRYDWYNSQNQRGKFLGKENIKTRFGLRIKAGLPPKLPFLRSAQVDLGPQATTYNTPNNNLGVSLGGALDLRINFGKREKEVKDAEREERMKRAQAQFARDNAARVQRDSVQLVEVDSFLSNNPQPIMIDSVRLAVDTTVHAPRLPWVKAPLPFTKGAKGVKLNDSKTEVFSLQNENNRLLAELKQDPSVWGEFQENQKKLNRAERKLARRED